MAAGSLRFLRRRSRTGGCPPRAAAIEEKQENVSRTIRTSSPRSDAMKRHVLGALIVLVGHAGAATAQGLSARWEELTGPDFVRALDASKGTCALPFGIIEKHGPAGPLGTDLFNVRYTTGLAANEEYTIIFPDYYFGQIFEARHQPGTIAYSSRLQLEMLQETVSEMARNGCQKIIIVNGHGGNNFLLQYFAQTQL